MAELTHQYALSMSFTEKMKQKKERRDGATAHVHRLLRSQRKAFQEALLYICKMFCSNKAIYFK
ncbi:hypothetical protein IscW_ISCW021551 [Ixodes scapularis]|uniref:Uncharacterized protein n=1 Tax=Ixodes scapularis TaxID=6945 RepID=B7Q6J0_IXOSC|nr:hypothetical protein IscW_ISCW021551 [Ixodes scapularis]|eukprot:XP_002411973.1 hypothetical protein IscW_ISCW021551 [Ixodes scapularis]